MFVHVWRGARTYEPGRAKVTTWLTAVARHHAIDILRWQSVRLDSSSLPLDDMSFTHDKSLPDPEEQAELSLQRKNVQDAISQLPVDQRQVLFLAYFKGYSQQQIAELLKQPLGTVKTRIRLGMQKLRQILIEEPQSLDASAAGKVSYPIMRRNDWPDMLNEHHILDMLPAYALGSLEADEARQVDDHLAGCYSCRQELAAYQQVADGLLVAVPEAMPSAALKSRLMQRVQRPEPKRTPPPVAVRPPRRLSFAGAFAALVLIVVLAASNLFLWQRLNHPEYMTGPLGMKAVALQNTEAAPDGSAYAIVSGDGKNGVIVVDHLPPLDAEHEYQVWLVRDGEQPAPGHSPWTRTVIVACV